MEINAELLLRYASQTFNAIMPIVGFMIGVVIAVGLIEWFRKIFQNLLEQYKGGNPFI